MRREPGWAALRSANMRLDMTSNADPEDIEQTRAAWDVPKERKCLRCCETFQSAWSGERICKRSHAWRSGEARASRAPNRGR